MTTPAAPGSRPGQRPKPCCMTAPLDGGLRHLPPCPTSRRLETATTICPANRRRRACDGSFRHSRCAQRSPRGFRYLEPFAHHVGVMTDPGALQTNRVPTGRHEDLAADNRCGTREIRSRRNFPLDDRGVFARHGGRSTRCGAACTDAARMLPRHALASPCYFRLTNCDASRLAVGSLRASAELAIRFPRENGVVGFSTSAGAEAGYPPTRHLDAFEYMAKQQTHRPSPFQQPARGFLFFGCAVHPEGPSPFCGRRSASARRSDRRRTSRGSQLTFRLAGAQSVLRDHGFRSNCVPEQPWQPSQSTASPSSLRPCSPGCGFPLTVNTETG